MPDKRYIRTCQECGHEQTAKNPADYTGKGFMEETWRDTKCRKCKSPALDYGREEYNCPCGKWHKLDECGNCEAMLYECQVEAHVCGVN